MNFMALIFPFQIIININFRHIDLFIKAPTRLDDNNNCQYAKIERSMCECETKNYQDKIENNFHFLYFSNFIKFPGPKNEKFMKGLI